MRIGKSVREIGEEDLRIVLGPLPNQPGRDQLRVGADRREGPDIAVAGRAFELLGHVPVLGVAVSPDLIGLDHFAGEVNQGAVLILGASLAQIGQQLDDVFFAAPVILTVARMLLPSTRQPMIWARFSVLSRFILTICLSDRTENMRACLPMGREEPNYDAGLAAASAAA
jgi:hypothetical protein